MFEYNGDKYYGDRSLVYDSIICLREIKDIVNFDQMITLSGRLPGYIIDLWIRSMGTNQLNLTEIKSDQIVDFLNHVDQYPTTGLSIDTMEHQIIEYFDQIKSLDPVRTETHGEYLKSLSIRYRLRSLYLWVHNKTFDIQS